ncbi:MAG: Fur family transcriptional regulator, ferric uptake regulator, partial [Solirubrobacteraceae bacterium]|nr:Fur family transcriptional regulator, ferric uptake regulator [Solirubrobacteraceae bacterium]
RAFSFVESGYRFGVATAPDWTQSTLEALKGDGYRNGFARSAVVELLGRQDCCLTAQEIFDQLRADGRRVGIASIYRVLDLLNEHGLVERVAVGQGQQALFERVAPDGEHHHHLLCEQCGRLVAFDDPGLERAIDSLSERLGVRVEHHDVVLRGACQRCD